MANEITNTENILVEFAEQNVVLVDPNQILVDGKPQKRLVKHEELVIYLNLQARVVPRSKVISGAGVETEALVDIFEGNINFLKPGDKDYLTTDWADVFTGGGDEGGQFNQKQYSEKRDPLTGKDHTSETIKNKRDPESFGIENVQISLNSAYIPTVTINFVDVRGKTLFEQGQNSPYAAFFQLPYPMFLLTVKGFYGKAVQYHLMMHKFNASFDPSSGNYNVQCNFIGRVSALLADITMQEVLNAPYMYPRQYEKNSEEEGVQKITTTRGAQVQHEVYNIYRRKGLIDKDFPDITLKELVLKVKTLETSIENSLTNYNLDSLNDIESYGKIVDQYTTRVLGDGGWRQRFLDTTQTGIYVDYATDLIYYTWKKEIGEDVEKRQQGIDTIKKYIKEGNEGLLANATFGSDKEEFIPVDIKYEDFVSQPVLGMPEGPTEWFIFRGTPSTFESKIGVIQTSYNQKKSKIESRLSDIINRVVRGNEGIGFNPTIRNLFAVLIAGADTFLRLMNETHLKAMDLRDNSDRLNALKGSGAPNSQLQKDEFVYPWPAYYVREDNEGGGQNFISTYPGATPVLSQTKAYIPETWPEVQFVEEYLRSMTVRDRFPLIGGENSSVGENWIPISAADFKNSMLYADTSYPPFYYEIWDRSVLHTFYSGIYSRLLNNKSYTTLQAMAILESIDMKTKTLGSFDLQEQLKNQKLDYNTFSTNGYSGSTNSFLQDLAPLTKWQLLIRDEINTEYIRDMVNKARYEIYPFVDLTQTNYGNEEEETETSLNTIKEYLKIPKEETNKIGFDTFPFIDLTYSVGIDGQSLPWVKRNLANGRNVGSYQDLYSISTSLIVSENLRLFTSQIKTDKELASFGGAPFYSDPKFLLDTSVHDYDDLVIKRSQIILDSKSSWTGFYSIASEEPSQILSNNDLLLTESEMTCGPTYGNLTPGKKQIVSLLNTPYFTNAFREGTLNDIGAQPNPYVSAAYLFLNSLPLASLREKALVDVDDGVAIHGDYIFATLNQVSAVHPLPYAWILKYGSIWHRYKKHLDTGVDILSSCWTDYNAPQGFSPSTNSLSTLYNLDVGTDNTPINFGGENYVGGNFTQINLGFYPELVNLTHWFVTGDLLYNNTTITGIPVTSQDINIFIQGKALNVKRNSDIAITPPQIPGTGGQDLSVNFWNAYYDTRHDVLTSGYTEPIYILYPSSGGLNKSQLQFEVNTDNYIGNTDTHNGAVRFLWPMAPYGYFSHTGTTKPQPWEYMNKVDDDRVMQTPFKVSDVGDYNSIEELFDVFSPDILNKFEEYFLNFCENEQNYNSGLEGLEFFSDNNSFEMLNSSNMETTNGMTFQSIMRELLVVPQYNVEGASTESEFGFNIAKAQNQKITTTLNTFLNKRLSFKFYNQNDLDIKVLKSFVGYANHYDFGTYQSNLPPNVPLATSEVNYPAEWNALRQQVGFFTDPELPTLHYKDVGSEITDFFIDMDVEFTVPNIKNLRKIIRMYVTERVRQQPTSSTLTSSPLVTANLASPNPPPAGFAQTFKSKIVDLILELEDSHAIHVNEIFSNSNRIFDDVPTRTQIDNIDPIFKTDVQKLELYQTFKTMNDKWVAGEEFGERTLFEDFLFFDRANRDIGDKAILDVEPFKLIDSDANANTTLLGFIGAIIKDNNFYFLPLPSYINFYGVTSVDGEQISKFNTSEEANSLFGTHLEVDYLDSKPKFLCMYVGEPSQHIDVQSDIYRYDTDSFLLGRTSDNPLFSNCTDPQKCNKVVAFNVDFGTENQGVFKGISLDQNEFRNTAESFRLTQNLADSSNDKTISTQGLNLFNIYRSRSYTAKVTSMGNACIQPTMYFNLRHVPMFTGPYLITDVEHNISPNNMETSFTGIRSPFFDLPDINDIVAKVNKSFLERVKGKVENDVQVGGFSAEGSEKDRGEHPPALPMGGKITRLIIHSTGSVDLGDNPVSAINFTHKEMGYAGIGFHYLIDRDNQASVLTARPSSYEGAHTMDANNNSLGIAVISSCAGLKTYQASGSELATANQKSTLEKFLLYQLFKQSIFRVVKNDDNTIILKIFGPAGTTSWPQDIESPLNGVSGKVYKEIIFGHNDFNTNKMCPCFKVRNALDGKLKDKINGYLKTVWNSILTEANNNISEVVAWMLEDGVSYLKPEMITDIIGKKLGIVIKPSVLPDDNFTGKPQSYNSGG
jgi:N-acetylmuramoyl-L-alanine amidase|tara:strand:+ start:12097 stop:18630 length:6534 start_codon:yes stop_codon:yes gene_type:complete